MATRIGPYLLGRPIGRGGMGVVHEAVHAESGELVALKMVRAPSAALLGRIRREIQVLAGLRHPGIVRVLDEGIHEGVPWYAMELARGRTLASIASELSSSADVPGGATPSGNAESRGSAESDPTEVRSWTGEAGGAVYTEPLPPPSALRPAAAGGDLPRALALVRRLCPPLRYLHGEGLVHRDLKPGNVIVRDDGSPVIIDFGLISRFASEEARDALELGGSVVGSVGYLAPEQARGELPDARADIYALGCILYELLAGRPPFRGMREEVLAQHLHAAPLPPSAFVEGVPPELDGLVLRLLAKEPRERPGYADEVAADLARIAGEPPAAPGPPARPYLYRPAASGRRGQLALLDARMSASLAGGFSLVLVSGESGSGKTRLLVEAAASAVRLGLQVIPGQCDARDRSPLHGWRGLLLAVADHCREAGPAGAERILGRRAAVLAAYEPAIAALPGVAGGGEAPPLGAAEGRARILLDLAATLRELRVAGGGALLLALDDLQWADELTLAFLPQLLRSRPPGVLVLAAHRSDEPRAAVDELAQRADVLSLEVGPLAAGEVGEVAADILALGSVPSPFAALLHRRTGGNPRFVGEYLREAVEQGLVGRRGGHFHVGGVEGEDLAMPRTLRALLERRLERLGEPARRLVEIAALLEGDLEAPLLEELAADEGLEAGLVARLVAARVLEEEGSMLRLADGGLRDAAVARLPPERRRALHLAAARRLERPELSGARPRTSLGRHWREAGEPERARDAYLAAARHSGARYALEEAESLYRAALALAGTPARAAAIRMELTERVLEARGAVRDAEAEARLALAEALASGEPALEAACRRLLGAALSRTTNADEAQQHLDLALAAFRRLGDRGNEATALASLGHLHSEHEHVEEAEAIYRAALALAREVGDLKLEGSLLGNLGVLHARRGDMSLVEGYLEQALAIHVATGQLSRESTTIGNLGNVWLSRGDIPRACRHYERALELARQAGDRRYEGLTLGNLAYQHVEAGRWREARELYDRSLAVAREVGDQRLEAVTLGNIAVLEMNQGNAAVALALFEDAIARHRSIGDRVYEGAWLSGMGYLLVTEGRVEEGKATLERSSAIHEELGNARMRAIDLGIFGLVACLEGSPGALEAADRGIAILEQLGERIPLAKSLCLRGHLLLAGGRSASAELERARSIAATLGDLGAGPIAENLARLARAQEAFEAGGVELVAGHVSTDLSPGALAWLRARRGSGP